MRRIGLVTREGGSDAGPVVRELARWLAVRGCHVVVDRETAAVVPGDVEVAERVDLPDRADLIVVLGGDGTLLAMARMVGDRGVPILGVNLGHLGFLTATTLAALYPTLETVLRGRYPAEDRMMLAASLSRDGEVLAEYLALNDIVISKGALGRLVDLEVSADGEMMTAYRADGLIIATPTGSTAYNLSAAGPILFPTMEAVVLTPICSHALTNRPIVLPATVELAVSLVPDVPDVRVWHDGQPGLALRAKDVVRIRRAQSQIRLIRDPQKTYFQVLRTKLKWGER